MIALTSHKPRASDPAYFERERLARLSWAGIFERVIYFGPEEKDLSLPGTEFRPSEPFPTIVALALAAAEVGPVATVINADIILRPEVKVAFREVESGRADWASSRRWWIEWNAEALESRMTRAVIRERGRDIWVARQAIWREAALHLPAESRIGHPRCDEYLWGALYKASQRGIDFTTLRAVFHAEHPQQRRDEPVGPLLLAGRSGHPTQPTKLTTADERDSTTTTASR